MRFRYKILCLVGSSDWISILTGGKFVLFSHRHLQAHLRPSFNLFDLPLPHITSPASISVPQTKRNTQQYPAHNGYGRETNHFDESLLAVPRQHVQSAESQHGESGAPALPRLAPVAE